MNVCSGRDRKHSTPSLMMSMMWKQTKCKHTDKHIFLPVEGNFYDKHGKFLRPDPVQNYNSQMKQVHQSQTTGKNNLTDVIQTLAFERDKKWVTHARTHTHTSRMQYGVVCCPMFPRCQTILHFWGPTDTDLEKGCTWTYIYCAIVTTALILFSSTFLMK